MPKAIAKKHSTLDRQQLYLPANCCAIVMQTVTQLSAVENSYVSLGKSYD